MIVFGRNPLRLNFGGLGILPAQVPDLAEFDSPLANDVDPGDENTALLWLVLNLPATGQLTVLDDGTFQHVNPGPASDVAYRLFAVPPAGAPVVSEAVITSGTAITQMVTAQVLDQVREVVVESVTVAAIAAQPSAPAFVLQPTGQQVSPGTFVLFSVSVTGVPAPALQWRRDGQPIAGANGPAYGLTASEVDSGAVFDVVATNPSGAVTSAAALLTLISGQVVTWADWTSDLTMFVPDCPVFTIEQALRRRADDFYRETRAWRSRPATLFTAVAGEADYTVTLPGGVELAGLPDVRYDGLEVEELDEEAVHPTLDPAGERPAPVLGVTGPRIVTVYPTPTVAGALVTGSVAYTIERAAAGLPYQQWRLHRECIEAMALEYLMSQQAKPWSNPREAASYRRTAKALQLAHATNAGRRSPTRLRVRPAE